MLSGLASNQGGWMQLELTCVGWWLGVGKADTPGCKGVGGSAGSLEGDWEHVFRRLAGISWMVAGKSGLVRWVGG